MNPRVESESESVAAITLSGSPGHWVGNPIPHPTPAVNALETTDMARSQTGRSFSHVLVQLPAWLTDLPGGAREGGK